jgi:hypothetical protein
VDVYHLVEVDQQDDEDAADGADDDDGGEEDGDGDGDSDVRFDLAYQLTDGEPEIAEDAEEEDDVMQEEKEERIDGDSYVLDSGTLLRVTTTISKLTASSSAAGPVDLQRRQIEIGGSSSVVYTSTLCEEGESEGERDELLRQQSASPRSAAAGGSGSSTGTQRAPIKGSDLLVLAVPADVHDVQRGVLVASSGRRRRHVS